jgi:pimeloyl-ACP methyl ester carboxylesterase
MQMSNSPTDGRADQPRLVREPNEIDTSAAFRAGPHDTIDIGIARLSYYRFGSGPDVVFLHGWPLNAATFRSLASRLSNQFTCHLFDLPGLGRTVCRADTAIDLAAHVESVRRALRALGLTEYALVGESSGGFVARLVAALDPRVKGIVLGNTPMPGPVNAFVAFQWYLLGVPGSGWLMRQLLQWGAYRRSAFGFARCFEQPSYADGEFYELVIKPSLASRRTMEASRTLFRSFDFQAMSEAQVTAHARIRAKTLLVWGAGDPVFRIERVREVLPQFQGRASLAEIPNGRMFAHEERAADFAAHASPFLAACFCKSAGIAT